MTRGDRVEVYCRRWILTDARGKLRRLRLGTVVRALGRHVLVLMDNTVPRRPQRFDRDEVRLHS